MCNGTNNMMFGYLWKWSIPVYPNDEPILSRLLSLKNNIDTYIYIHIMSITEQSWTWVDLGVLTRLVIGWGNLCIMDPGIWFSLEHPPFGSPLPAQICTRPIPFKPRSDKDPLVADLQSECSCGCANWSWTMDNGPKKNMLPVVNIPKKQGNCGRGFSNLVWDTFPDIRHLNLTCGICQTECQIKCQNIYIYILYIYTYRIYTSRWYVKIMCQGGNHSKKVMKFLASLPAGRVDSFCAENSMKVAFKHCGNCSPQTNLAYCWSGSCSGGISLTLKYPLVN